jgi:hypothetical protein
LDKDYITGLCLDVYTEELDKDSGYLDLGGVPVKERVIKRYMEWRKCSRDKGEAYYVECSRFYQKHIERVIKILTARNELKQVKGAKEADRNFDPDYVYDLSADLYAAIIGGADKFIKKHMKERKSTKERATKRFREYAQNYAPIVRSILKALAMRDQLPKRAYKEKKK